jgi:hypothetical protein
MIFRRTEVKRTVTAASFLSSQGMAAAAKASGAQAEAEASEAAGVLVT